MSKETASTELAIPVAEFTPKQKHLYSESLALFERGTQANWIANLLKAASLYNIKTFNLHHIDGLTWDEYIQAIGISGRQVRRFLQIADRMKEMCCKTLRAAKIDQPEFDFMFNQQVIKSTFEKFFTLTGTPSMRGLAQNAADHQQFENYLSGNAELSEKELTKLLAPVKTKHDELPPVKPNLGDDLFTTYNNMKAKGYVWNIALRRFTNPDGSELTLMQLGECVVEEDGFKIFGSVASVIEEAKENIAKAVEVYGRFYKAYTLAHRSPDAEKKSNEELMRLTTIIKQFNGFALTLTPEEND